MDLCDKELCDGKCGKERECWAGKGMHEVGERLPCASFGSWGGKTTAGCNACKDKRAKGMEKTVLAPIREAAAAAAARDTALLDLVPTPEEKRRMAWSIFASSAFANLSPADTLLLFATRRVRFGMTYWEMLEAFWTEVLLSFQYRGGTGNESTKAKPVWLIPNGGGRFRCVGKEDLMAAGAYFKALYASDRIGVATGSSLDKQKGAVEGILIEAILSAGTGKSYVGGGRMGNHSATARGCSDTSECWGMVVMLVIPGGWERLGWVLMDHDKVHASSTVAKRGLLYLPTSPKPLGTEGGRVASASRVLSIGPRPALVSLPAASAPSSSSSSSGSSSSSSSGASSSSSSSSSASSASASKSASSSSSSSSASASVSSSAPPPALLSGTPLMLNSSSRSSRSSSASASAFTSSSSDSTSSSSDSTSSSSFSSTSATRPSALSSALPSAPPPPSSQLSFKPSLKPSLKPTLKSSSKGASAASSAGSSASSASSASFSAARLPLASASIGSPMLNSELIGFAAAASSEEGRGGGEGGGKARHVRFSLSGAGGSSSSGSSSGSSSSSSSSKPAQAMSEEGAGASGGGGGSSSSSASSSSASSSSSSSKRDPKRGTKRERSEEERSEEEEVGEEEEEEEGEFIALAPRIPRAAPRIAAAAAGGLTDTQYIAARHSLRWGTGVYASPLLDENLQQFYQRVVDNRSDWEENLQASRALRPPSIAFVQAGAPEVLAPLHYFDGIDAAIASGSVMRVSDNTMLYRAVTLKNATETLAALAAGAPPPTFFARPGPPLTKDQTGKQIVQQVQKGSHMETRMVSWTTNSRVAEHFARAAKRGGKGASNLVVGVRAGDVLEGRFLWAADCPLLVGKDATTARKLKEVHLHTPTGFSCYFLASMDGRVVGDMGPESTAPKVAWDGAISGAVFMATGLSIAGALEERIYARGGRTLSAVSTTVTVLVSAGEGTANHKKTVHAEANSLPIITLEELEAALVVAQEVPEAQRSTKGSRKKAKA